ncbi:MAG TPA: hypothetical protein DCS93_22085 [Microscillaceae bacterium]|nr:hypothetical protein [Microscillaceae bacterium]
MRELLSLRKTRFLLAGNILSHVGNGIAMIAVPWLFVKQANGDQIYGYTTMAAALITMLMLLYIGTLIDKFSRKKILVVTEWVGLIGTIVIALLEWQNEQPSVYSLVTMFLMGSMIYSMHFPTRFAFTQEIFEPRHYQQLNGLLEIQGQIAFMVAGGLGGFLVEHTTFTNVMLIDAATFLLGAVFFMLIPYKPTPKEGTQTKSAWVNLKEGISFIRTYKHTTNFFVFTMLPFISVLIGLFLIPIYVSDVLKADATVYGWHEVIWAIGSIIAGITIPVLAQKVRGRELVILSVSVYSLTIILLVLDIGVLAFLAVSMLMGWGNAGRRVARATVIMENVDNKMIGRMNATLMSFGKLIQFFLVYIFTLIIPLWGAKSAFAVLGVLLVFICWGAWVSNKRFVSALEFQK